MEAPSEPRYITTDQTVQGLGLNILGGNATGIFVCDVKSPGYDLGIRVGDQILEVSFESVGSILATDSCEKSLSTPCRKLWVFPGCSGFLPQGKLNTVRKAYGSKALQ